MALPKEIQDLLDFIDEQDPFEANNPNLSPHILVETACKWLTSAIEKGRANPRLINLKDGTANRLQDLARQYALLKERGPSR